ncbi:hypothetical protein PM082_002378 [Marasmius tenuissimus]|nr:hypothetical protein PM082_002378 [Marasmius tenuissimus]
MSGWDGPVLDFDDIENFRAEEWINKGKKWPENPPTSLYLAKPELLSIPENAFAPSFPVKDSLTPRQFINLELPTHPTISLPETLNFGLAVMNQRQT